MNMGLAWSCPQKASLKLQARMDKQMDCNHIIFMILRQVQLVHPVFKFVFPDGDPNHEPTLNQPTISEPSFTKFTNA